MKNVKPLSSSGPKAKYVVKKSALEKPNPSGDIV
jgi:hypothetical protein